MTDFDTLMQEAFSGFGDECNKNAEREYSTFLNLAIQSFDVNTQWSGGSQLDATLYEDVCGDEGREPAVFHGLSRNVIHPVTDNEVTIEQHYKVEDMIGAPYRFSMGDFEFCGLLQSIKETSGENGERSWKVTLKSPDELVKQIHLLVGGYYGDLDISNIFNVGKEIENQKAFYIQFFWWLNDTIQSYISEWMQDPKNQSTLNNLPRHRVIAHMKTMGLRADVINTLTNPDGAFRALFPVSTAGVNHDHATVPFQLGGLMNLAEEIQRDFLNFISPTIDGSLLYQEVVWAFNKIQAEGEGVRFNHANYSTNVIHPDVLVENGYTWNGNYYIDLSELPGEVNSFLSLDQLPRGFRIQESDLTLASFIETVCGEDGFRCDHLWELRPSVLRQIQIRQEKLEKILKREQGSNEPNAESIKQLQELISDCTGLMKQWEPETKFRIPIIKLKLCPQGYNSSESNVRHIIRVVDHLKNTGIGINNWSAGFEKADDMPSVLLNGAKKEIIVTAGNNLFNHRSFQTGDPFSPRNTTVHPPQSFFTNSGRQYQYPSVWKMYFGQDRYNCPQVMFSEWLELPIDFINNKPGRTTYQINSVYLDTWELKAGLRFFANNVNSGLWGLDEDPEDNRPFMSEMQYNVPDYIKISENEIRASIEFDLFWWTAAQHGGELYNLFLSVLGRTTITDALFSGGNPWSGITSRSSELEAQEFQAQIQNMLGDRFAADGLGNTGRLNTPPEVLEMIIADLKCIQGWVKKKCDDYYAKQYVTPFYFREVTEMYDSNGERVTSFEPISEGFREYGGIDFLGLRIQNTLQTGLRGLEVFTSPEGRTQAFVRFHDPLREVTLIPPKDGQGNIIPNGWGNGIAPRLIGTDEWENATRQKDVPLTYLINTVDTANLTLDSMVKNADFLYYKITSVEHIKTGNLVHIVLDQPVYEYQTDESPDSFADFLRYNPDHRQLAETNPHIYIQMKRNYELRQKSVGASYVIAATTPKAKIPIDGCYGVRCHFVCYGPWILRNGNNPGKYQSDESLAPWKFGNQLMDAGEAHELMHKTGLLMLASQIATHKYSHIAEDGTICVAGYPSLRVGNEIGSLTLNALWKQLNVVRHWSVRFGNLYGSKSFGHRFALYPLAEQPYTGQEGPNVTRITVNVGVDGDIKTTYDINKYTPKDGFLGKVFMDKIQMSSNITKARTGVIMEEVKRRFDNWQTAYTAFKSRNQEDYAAGKHRFNSHTEHNVFLSQTARDTYAYVDEKGNFVQVPFVRTQTTSGISASDVTHLMRSDEEYLSKAVMSSDGLVAPFATTDVKDKALLEQEYRQRLGRELTPDEQAFVEEQIKNLDMPIPHMKKPTNTRSTMSVSDGWRFLTREALTAYNEGREFDLSQMVPSHPINNRFLNPLVNPAEVDHNDLMANPVGAKSKSTLGHTVAMVTKGLIPQDDISFKGNLREGNSPYSPHYRGIGLKAPVQITGFGYSTDNLPVPREAASANWFAKDWAARQDLHVTGPLDIRFDEDRGVWTIPTPRMYFVVLLEDMKTIDVSAKNEQDDRNFWEGYDRGKPRGEEDRRTDISNQINAFSPLNARNQDVEWFNEQEESVRAGYNTGYEHGFYDLPRPKRITKPNKIIRGEAQILNPKNGIVGYINVETLAGTPMRKGEKCFAWQDAAEEKYYAIPTGITINTGVVVREIEPTGGLDENGDLTGGGWISISRDSSATSDTGNNLIRAYCGMVREMSQAIPSGSIVEIVNIGGRANIINRLC